MRTVRHFILKKLYRIQFFVGGRLIIRSQALTHLRLKEIYVSGMNFYLDIVANHFFLEDAWRTSPSIQFYTDAAKTVGYGIVFGTRWAFGEWPVN